LSRLYASPLRVYLLLGALALMGLYCGFQLPVSLFPNSSKPKITVMIPYGGATPDEFLLSYGKDLEDQLKKITTDKVEVEKVTAMYGPHQARYDLEFKWGAEPRDANREVLFVVNSYAARFPTEIRDSLNVWINSDNAGFIAVSYFSEERSLDDLYNLLEPLMTPKLSQVKDALDPGFYNPEGKEIRIDLNPAAMAPLQLLPKDVEAAVAESLPSRGGGSITIGTRQFSIQMPRAAGNEDQVRNIVIVTPSGRAVHLSDIANVTAAPQTVHQRSFKTNGAASIIMFADPRPGGNIKKMAEDVIKVVEETQPTLPKDVQYRVLVDPSQFIRSAVNNVLREVFIAAFLAVIVLFVFIGSLRNVITAAIEIPISMVLAFILMRLSGMNLNLISLGGLALSAGMNVDASVVVMENIFRHFEMNPGPHSYESRLRLLVQAVKEVQFPIIASTISSLVVFLPLTFTSDLSYAILGDLAKAVVFSHGFSAIVALILVPTVRLQLMAGGGSTHSHSPIEGQLKRLENGYGWALSHFLGRPWAKWAAYGSLGLVLAGLVVFILPRLEREVVGRPDTDWMMLHIDTSGNTMIRQMEVQVDEIERDYLAKFGNRIQYTFVEVEGANFGTIMGRLKDKGDMRDIWKEMQAHFADTPFVKYKVEPWNPSELPIPDPPHLRLAVRGGNSEDRAKVAEELNTLLKEKKIFERAWSEPNSRPNKAILIDPHAEQWAMLKKSGQRVGYGDVMDMLRIGTDGKKIGTLPYRNRTIDILLHYPQNLVSSFEDVASLPIGLSSKLVPLRALAEVNFSPAPYPIRREEGRELFLVEARKDVGHETEIAPAVEKTKTMVADWTTTHEAQIRDKGLTIVTEDPAIDLTDAIHQLGLAVALSIFLIFITLLIQFGTVIEPLLVLVSVPLGFIGVLASLWICGSTLSLNSILGVILLNGIAVANSIILVDFVKRLVAEGRSPREAAVEAARKRLRPILITSLTTVLGMLPVAFGLGEGGRILQPLGIAVSGGLWISMALTLFLVPALQVSYLEWRERRRQAPVATSPWWLTLVRKPAGGET
jgi:HAE1 family hydrophobic/amphiphilic exporter-1